MVGAAAATAVAGNRERISALHPGEIGLFPNAHELPHALAGAPDEHAGVELVERGRHLRIVRPAPAGGVGGREIVVIEQAQQVSDLLDDERVGVEVDGAFER